MDKGSPCENGSNGGRVFTRCWGGHKKSPGSLWLPGPVVAVLAPLSLNGLRNAGV